MEEIAAGLSGSKSANKQTARKPKTAAKVKKTTAKKPRSAKTVKAKRAQAATIRQIRKVSSTEKPAALPAFVKPCLATLANNAPESANWIHEIKFDGYRLQARLEAGKVTLLTRNGLDWTRKFAAIAKAVAALSTDQALIDGELVVEDPDGVSSFSLLQQELNSGRQDRLVFYAFDLLHLDGSDLRPLPLLRRKDALASLIKSAPENGAIRFSESIDESGSVLLKHACRMHLEGIVSKRSDAPYRSGRGHDWIKTKCTDRQEFVIAGFVPASNDARAVGALVLGVFDKGKLRYAGRTGTGFSHSSARDLYRKLQPLKRTQTAFVTLPAEERGARGPIWVEPKLVAEVDFHSWTQGGRVRHASFQGLREDKAAGDVVIEVQEKSAAAINKSATVKKRSAPVDKSRVKKAGKNAKAVVGSITLTHPDRVYWEDAGVTKLALAEYYRSVWKWMSPHVTGRPISLLRCPEGAGGQCFFQKHAAAGIATDHLRLVPEKADKIISIDDLDGLISLVQAGVLEVHTRGTTADDRDNADRLVIDLDPGPGTGWKDVVAAARDVRARLDALKLKSFLKTSGGKGLHVVLPIAPTPWDDAKAFTQGLAGAMAADDPDRYVATATKSKRNKRIFIDYLRNSHDATAVAPYSTRARPGAPVSAPIDWSELGSLKSASHYTVLNLPARLERLRKDPWATIGRYKQRLPRLQK